MKSPEFGQRKMTKLRQKLQISHSDAIRALRYWLDHCNGIAEVRVRIPAKLKSCVFTAMMIFFTLTSSFRGSSLQLWNSPSKGDLRIWRTGIGKVIGKSKLKTISKKCKHALTMLILFSFMRILTHTRKENKSLSFSNKLRHTFEYKLNVK